MNKNIAFLVRENRPFISLTSISDVLDLPENTLRGLLFNEEVEKDEYFHEHDTFYLSEKAACSLLNDIDDLDMDVKYLDRFHIWMHGAFEEMATRHNESGDKEPCEDCERPDCSGCEHEDEDDGSCELGKFLDTILVRLAHLELRLNAMEKECK